MGYCIDQRESRFCIRKENLTGALAALKGLAQVAGASLGDFRWVSTSVILAAQSVQEHLKAWRWDASFDEDGNLSQLKFRGEKMGNDKDLFNVLAPFVSAGSFIVMQGEDGEMWRWFFDGQCCKEQNADVRFPDAPEGLGDVIDVTARDVTPETRPSRVLPPV